MKKFILGTYSLPVTYWLVTIPAFIALGLFARLIGMQAGTPTAFIWLFAYLLLTIATTIAMWNSATKYKGKLIWIWIVKFQCIVTTLSVALVLFIFLKSAVQPLDTALISQPKTSQSVKYPAEFALFNCQKLVDGKEEVLKESYEKIVISELEIEIKNPIQVGNNNFAFSMKNCIRDSQSYFFSCPRTQIDKNSKANYEDTFDGIKNYQFKSSITLIEPNTTTTVVIRCEAKELN